MELLRKWDKILLHLPAELCYITPCVAVAHHAAVSEAEIVLISHLFRLFRAALYQLVVEVVQFLLVSREKGGILLPCLHTHCPVRTVQIRVHQGKVQGLAIPVNLRGCKKLVVSALKLILLLHQRQNLLVHRLHREFDVLERNLADLLLQVRPELRMEKHLLITDVQVLDVRHHGIIKILLSLIKFICHIDIMPDLRQCRFCHDMADYLIIVLMDRKLLLSAVRLRKTLLQIRKILSYSFHVDAAVRHLLEFHSCLRSLLTVRPSSVCGLRPFEYVSMIIRRNRIIKPLCPGFRDRFAGSSARSARAKHPADLYQNHFPDAADMVDISKSQCHNVLRQTQQTQKSYPGVCGSSIYF